MNETKTKVTIFGTRKTNKTNLRFQYQGKNLEVVNCFKYLGIPIMFNLNGHFNMCKKDLSEPASKAMFSLLSKLVLVLQYSFRPAV